MIFENHILEKPLAAYIESIFYYKGYKPDHSVERVVPTGHVFIIFELNGFEYHTFDSDTLQPNGSYKNVWVSGMHKEYLSISAHQNSEMLVIQFKTDGAYPFLQLPIHKLNNKVIAAQELFGAEILVLREQILKAENATEKFNWVEAWLTQKIAVNKIPDGTVVNVLKQLKTKPLTDSREIIASYPNTQKHLIHQFKKYFGLTPKVFHRIFRFNELLKKLQNKQPLIWAQIAYEFGYSDQSHFIKEFKEFSGFNPQEFIKSGFHEEEETNFFPLDRKG
ncbi:helix-turn-helix domain-containing protein [Aquimarina intermedia]|uniref:AraC family transcriptional regulator n=1 Tax=Aquimarina intermedia TaxID=350814 RepID=A0A5S5BYV8_9FLAO|nr:helix-turn-helix domain-containing protein [Aquimarina intermedia]TYP72129.1 AraC family transcriptional regulator [Aquimarina intermedia]